MSLPLFCRSFLVALALVFPTCAVTAQITPLWGRRYNGAGNSYDYPNAVTTDFQGNVYVTGTAWNSASGSDGSGYDFITVKYSPEGAYRWERRYNGPANGYDEATAMTVDSEGNLYVTGMSYNAARNADIVLIKYDLNGLLKWAIRYNGVIGRFDVPTAIALDAQKNVIVVGRSEGFESGYDYLTLKYSTDGKYLWERRVNGTGNSEDTPAAMTIDPAGNIYVTGMSLGATTGYDYLTLKYDANGFLRWSRRYNGGSDYYDEARGVAVGADGSVYVTGLSYLPVSGDDCVTVKYNANGVQQWARRYNGPGNGYDGGIGLAIDSAGKIVVAGYADGGASGTDFLTLKYDENGFLKWGRRYNGPANGFDMPVAMLADGFEEVVVAGYTVDGNGNYDLSTIKYDTNGTLLWANRYNGTGGQFDAATALTVDRDDNLLVVGESWGLNSFVDYVVLKFAP